jgi:hypothetical protein
MIIDCDTHFMPADAFSFVPEPMRSLAPRLEFDDDGILADVKFPGAPARVRNQTLNLPAAFPP